MSPRQSQSLEETANDLARAHRDEDPDTSRILFSADHEAREIRLIEISESVATTGELLPFRFQARPEEGIPYPSNLIVVSPRDWERVESGELTLPESWGSPESFVPLEETSEDGDQ